jgi:hypothetical protein
MREQQQWDIEELAKLLKLRKGNGQPTVLLLGARAGELFRNRYFYESLRGFSHRDFNNLSRIEQFCECYTILTKNPFSETDIHSILRASLRDLAITKTDAYLAELVKQGYFDEIISTNIDDVLERSFLQADMQEHKDFEVTIPVRETLHERSLPHRIFKIYGDFGSRMYIIKERLSHLDKNQEIKSALQRILARDVIIVGVDHYWDEDIFRTIPSQSGTIFFINEDEQAVNHSIFKERKAHYIRGSYEDFMRELYNCLCEGLELPINYQLAKEILTRLTGISRQLQYLLDEQKIIISEIAKIQKKED